MTNYLLDTNVIIDFLREKRGVAEYLLHIVHGGGFLYSCEVTVAEVFSGMREKERSKTEAFMESLVYIPMNRQMAQKAGEMKSHYKAHGKNLTIVDCMIAAVVISNDCILLTENLKDFPMPQIRKKSIPKPDVS
jgi:predicted nucleic acid-binding protein